MSLVSLTLQVSSGSLGSLIDQCDFADDNSGEYDCDDQDDQDGQFWLGSLTL